MLLGPLYALTTLATNLNEDVPIAKGADRTRRDPRCAVGCGDLPPLNHLMLTRSQYETMRAHVESCAPLESCGLLAGKDGTVSRVFLIANQAQSPDKVQDGAGRTIAGVTIGWRPTAWICSRIFHSHPTGPETLVRHRHRRSSL